MRHPENNCNLDQFAIEQIRTPFLELSDNWTAFCSNLFVCSKIGQVFCSNLFVCSKIVQFQTGTIFATETNILIFASGGWKSVAESGNLLQVSRN